MQHLRKDECVAHPYIVSEQQCSIHVSAELSYSIRVGIVFVSKNVCAVGPVSVEYACPKMRVYRGSSGT